MKWHPRTERQKQDLQIAYAELLNENARLVSQIFDLKKENKTLRRIEDLKNRLKQERSTLRKAYRRG